MDAASFYSSLISSSKQTESKPNQPDHHNLNIKCTTTPNDTNQFYLEKACIAQSNTKYTKFAEELSEPVHNEKTLAQWHFSAQKVASILAKSSDSALTATNFVAKLNDHCISTKKFIRGSPSNTRFNKNINCSDVRLLSCSKLQLKGSIGYKILERIGWRCGTGIGKKSTGFVQPIPPIIKKNNKFGIGFHTRWFRKNKSFNLKLPQTSFGAKIIRKIEEKNELKRKALFQLVKHDFA
ncbi:hypothetical protein BB561_002267 [Smittium simulii]|uniref:G-patch domain-containing protein n=1 Tax=Smittium simulii TaxID=133385 RepID=A0A2T9YQX3_9FUNG|nr:hypothetical protein BB561_002267 [Smittium simulii]